MRITWLGHSGFRIEAGGKVLLLDPWLEGCPTFPDERRAEALEGATHVLLTHAHFDHASEAEAVLKETGAKAVGIFDLVGAFGDEAIGFNKGGTVDLDGVRVTMVNAVHSSSWDRDTPAGSECGFMIEADGRTLYAMGDTDVMADMALFQELHAPSFGIVPIGGHFTMDPDRAAFACTKFFDFQAVIPCHYGTFDALTQSAEGFEKAVAPTKVVAPAVMEAVDL